METYIVLKKCDIVIISRKPRRSAVCSYQQIAESPMHQLEVRTRSAEAYGWQLMFSRLSVIIHADPTTGI